MPRALKIVLMDASALLDLGRGELIHDYAMRPESQSGQAHLAEHVLRQLSKHYTVVISRVVLNEILPSASGCLDLERDENGVLQFPKHRHPFQIRQPDSLVLYNALESMAQDGLVRSYASTSEMLEAGEVSVKPRGGIVIVDTKTDPELWRPITAAGERRYPSREYHRQAVPFPDIEELRPATMQPKAKSAPVEAQSRQIVPNKRNNTQQNTVIMPHTHQRPGEAVSKSLKQGSKTNGASKTRNNPYSDLGDRTLLSLASDISTYVVRNKLPRVMLFANGDSGLSNKMSEQQKRLGRIIIVRTHELLWGMAMEQQLDETIAHSMTNALEIEHKQRGHVLLKSQDKFVDAVRKMQNWMKSETQPEPSLSHAQRLQANGDRFTQR